MTIIISQNKKKFIFYITLLFYIVNKRKIYNHQVFNKCIKLKKIDCIFLIKITMIINFLNKKNSLCWRQ